MSDPNGNNAMYAAILQGIGAPVTAGNLAVMAAWHKIEGGDKTGRYNPFNSGQTLNRTTSPPSHITADPFAGGMKVVSYHSQKDGVAGTVSNLLNGMYDDVVAGFQASNPLKTIQAIVSSPWEETHYAAKSLNGQYSAQSSLIYKVYVADGATGAKGTVTTDDPSIVDKVGGIVGGVADAVTPDNLNPLDAIQSALAPFQAILGGLDFLRTHWSRILLGLLAVGILITGVVLANRSNIAEVATTATKVV